MAHARPGLCQLLAAPKSMPNAQFWRLFCIGMPAERGKNPSKIKHLGQQRRKNLI
jgi:hypothetical protein